MGQQRALGGPREAPGGVSRPFQGPSAVVLAPTVTAANGEKTEQNILNITMTSYSSYQKPLVTLNISSVGSFLEVPRTPPHQFSLVIGQSSS